MAASPKQLEGPAGNFPVARKIQKGGVEGKFPVFVIHGVDRLEKRMAAVQRLKKPRFPAGRAKTRNADP